MSQPAEEREREEFLKALGAETTLESDLITRLHWADEKYTRVRDTLLRRGQIERIGPYKIRATIIPIKRAFEVAPLETCSKEDIWKTASELYHKYKDITKKEMRKGVVYETPKWTVFNWRTYLHWACRKYGSYLTPFSDEEYHDPEALKDYSSPAEFVESNDGLKFRPPQIEDYTAYEETLKKEESEKRAEELHYFADELKKFRRTELKKEDIFLLSDKHIRSYERSIKQARTQRDAAKRENKLKANEIDRLKWELDDLKGAEKRKPLPPPPVRWTKELEEKLRDRYYATLSRLGIRITTGLRARFRDELHEFKKLETEKEMLKASEELAHIISREIARVPEIIPKPKILPPIPETCPIDGTKLELVERVPLFIPDPLRLTSEEAYYRAALGLPLPVEHLEWIPVPPTMKVWMCKAPEPHYFERRADGRLIQRTQEFLYRKILVETAKLRKIIAPPPVAIPVRPPIPRPPKPLMLTFPRWLPQVKGMTFTEYAGKTEEQRKTILSEYTEWTEKQIRELHK